MLTTEQKKLNRKTATSVREDSKGWTHVRYHDTDVVSFNADWLIVRTGGWFTNTTKSRINEASDVFALGVSCWGSIDTISRACATPWSIAAHMGANGYESEFRFGRMNGHPTGPRYTWGQSFIVLRRHPGNQYERPADATAENLALVHAGGC